MLFLRFSYKMIIGNRGKSQGVTERDGISRLVSHGFREAFASFPFSWSTGRVRSLSDALPTSVSERPCCYRFRFPEGTL